MILDYLLCEVEWELFMHEKILDTIHPPFKSKDTVNATNDDVFSDSDSDADEE